jgi:hypothetical protein
MKTLFLSTLRRVASVPCPSTEDALGPVTSTLPSPEDQTRCAWRERVAVAEGIDVHSPLVQRMFDIAGRRAPDLTFNNGGVFVSAFELEAAGLTGRLELLGLPRGTVAIAATTRSGVERHGRQRALLEEIFHALEGPDLAPITHRRKRFLLPVRENVNDWLQILFYPSDPGETWRSDYTRWTPAQQRALIREYRDLPRLNPNDGRQIRHAITRLHHDASRRVMLTPEGEPAVHLSELLGAGPRPEVRAERLVEYLGHLLQCEHFSRYPKLFDSWRPRA